MFGRDSDPLTTCSSWIGLSWRYLRREPPNGLFLSLEWIGQTKEMTFLFATKMVFPKQTTFSLPQKYSRKVQSPSKSCARPGAHDLGIHSHHLNPDLWQSSAPNCASPLRFALTKPSLEQGVHCSSLNSEGSASLAGSAPGRKAKRASRPECQPIPEAPFSEGKSKRFLLQLIPAFHQIKGGTSESAHELRSGTKIRVRLSSRTFSLRRGA